MKYLLLLPFSIFIITSCSTKEDPRFTEFCECSEFMLKMVNESEALGGGRESEKALELKYSAEFTPCKQLFDKETAKKESLSDADRKIYEAEQKEFFKPCLAAQEIALMGYKKMLELIEENPSILETMDMDGDSLLLDTKKNIKEIEALLK